MLRPGLVESVVKRFLATLDPDECSSVGQLVDELEVRRRLTETEDPDSEDVADAIWRSLEGAEECLPEDCFVDLVDIVDEELES